MASKLNNHLLLLSSLSSLFIEDPLTHKVQKVGILETNAERIYQLQKRNGIQSSVHMLHANSILCSYFRNTRHNEAIASTDTISAVGFVALPR